MENQDRGWRRRTKVTVEKEINSLFKEEVYGQIAGWLELYNDLGSLTSWE